MKYIKEIRENLKDPKKKAITQLALYGIFFIIVFLLIGGDRDVSPTSPVVKKESAVEVYNNMRSYNYKITYTTFTKVDIVEGAYYNGKSLFSYNNFNYYYDDSIYKIDNDTYYLENIEYNIAKMFNTNLSSIFEKLEEESKTTYKDGIVVTNYKIKADIVYNYLTGMESNYASYTRVSITEEDDIIIKISINMVEQGLALSMIEVEYSNINNIESLEFNKDNYTYKENV